MAEKLGVVGAMVFLVLSILWQYLRGQVRKAPDLTELIDRRLTTVENGVALNTRQLNDIDKIRERVAVLWYQRNSRHDGRDDS